MKKHHGLPAVAPQRGAKAGAPYPRDFFVHLLRIVTLYASVVATILLLFSYIEVLYPDPLSFYYPGALAQIRSATATLIVMFPVFLLCGWVLSREIARYPEKAEYRIRKWLLYVTLFIAAITMIVDLITLLQNFLSGELTMRFLLKVAVVLVVAAVVFAYFLWDARRTDFGNRSVQNVSAFLVSTALIASVAAGFVLVGSPMYQRRVRLDEERLMHLQQIQNEVMYRWQLTRELPRRITDLRDDIRGFVPPVDPETGEAYGYRPTGVLSFELCAVFTVPTPDPIRASSEKVAYPRPMGHYGDSSSDTWVHEEGSDCFTRTIDPELYPAQEESLMRPAKPL